MKSIITAQRRYERMMLTILARRLGGRADRGDVPGWVLITIMTAGLVTALWAIAGPQLSSLFSDAISSVKGP
jgi:hypothetical protein